jgi:ATPase family associated with various cellular activities (AAA)
MTMTPSQLARVLSKRFKSRTPTLIVGPPGVGKSDIVEAGAREAEADLMISHPAVADPTDAKGLPWAEQGAQYASFLPFGDLARAMNATRDLVWFFDDLGQGTPAVQASYMQLLLAREVAGHKIPDCVTFVAATNRRQDRAGVNGILEPVKSRFTTIINLEPNVRDWLTWANAHDIRPEVIGYVRLRPEVITEYAPSADMTNSPCPRTIAALSRLLDEDHDPRDEFEVYAGAIGTGRAGEFVGFLNMFREIDDVDTILLNPTTAIVPSEPSALYAVAAALAGAANKNNFDRVFTYCERLPQEFAVYAIRDAQRRTPTVVRSPAWNRYIASPLAALVAGEDA